MRCSQECPVLLLLLHFVLILAAGHEELSDPGRFLSFFADQGQCGAVYVLLAEAACVCMLQVNAWVGKVCAYQNQYAAKVKILPCMCLCCMWFCRSAVPVRPVHCPPGEIHRRWRLHLPLCVPPPQGWASQAWPATPRAGGTGLLQGQLQGSRFNVQSDCKPSPGLKWLHPGEEERQRQQHRASPPRGELLPPPWHRRSPRRAGNGCHQHLQRTGRESTRLKGRESQFKPLFHSCLDADFYATSSSMNPRWGRGHICEKSSCFWQEGERGASLWGSWYVVQAVPGC